MKVFAALLFLACSTSRVDTHLLQGAWTSGGPSFDFEIKEKTILFEQDMKEHPYHLEGDTMVIDRQDPAIGIQRKKIVRLTDSELVWEDETYHSHETYRRMK